MGAYLPRWFMKPQHVNPQKALLIHKDLAATRSYATHWGTYQPAAESLKQTREDLTSAKRCAAKDKDEQLKALAIGETKTIIRD
ncbi:hypothetical protein [Pseudidiomarina sp. CB1]|uniref:hypothetical protein n=1 Tax=Pseudidiomarina sp. CB1 TaxID=2972484 RepID=UPI0038621D9E